MVESRPLPEVFADIFAQEGAILEEKGDGCLEFIIPSFLSRSLNIPEHGILGFSTQCAREGTIAASYESELFRTIERLFAMKGRMARATFPSQPPNIEKLSRWVSEKVILSNAVLRLQKVEDRRIVFPLIFFKYAALSDEKREGVFSVLVNDQNLSVQLLNEQWLDFWGELKESDEAPGRVGNETLRALHAGISAASLIAREELDPFIKGLGKRLNRDVERVFEYYETMKSETRKAFGRKGLSERDDPSHAEEAKEKLAQKLGAIEGEKRWKIQDLIDKYALKATIEPFCVIEIETHSPVFWMEMKRRLASRPFPLPYNPLFKRMDPLPCEACFYPRGAYFLCDEKLHVLCSNCYRKCKECHKEYCPICYRDQCPKCGRKKPQGEG